MRSSRNENAANDTYMCKQKLVKNSSLTSKTTEINDVNRQEVD